jgi:hypothetical protein
MLLQVTPAERALILQSLYLASEYEIGLALAYESKNWRTNKIVTTPESRKARANSKKFLKLRERL